MHAFLADKKKQKFQVILHFFHKISEKLMQKKKKAKISATLHFPLFSRAT
jgi:hypothetical protein